MFLNAALPEEKALGVAHGFKVLTAEPDDLEWMVRRHHDAIFADAGNEWKVDFPYVQKGDDGLQALWIAPSLLLALHETASTISVFLEKVCLVGRGPPGLVCLCLCEAGCVARARIAPVFPTPRARQPSRAGLRDEPKAQQARPRAATPRGRGGPCGRRRCRAPARLARP